MRISRLIALAWLALACAVAPAHAEKRVALVIGNGAYQHLNRLANSPNDARDLADALRSLDFDVDLGIDLPLAEMQRKVRAFERRAQTADVALAFFAGHGVQAPDPAAVGPQGAAQVVNYLLPVDADINDAADLGFLLTARDILGRLQGAGSVRVLILDACRNNPIPQRLARGRTADAPRGLGPEPKTSGTLIAYSTQPGTVADDGAGRNSPFVKALLDHIAEPGLDIRLLFTDVRRDVIRVSNGTQTPETLDSLDGRFSFRQAAPAGAAAPVMGGALPAGPAADEVAWSFVKGAADAGLLRRFIAQYPSSARRREAEEQLKALEQVAMMATPVRWDGTVPLTAAQERGLKPKDVFRECENCPEMVVVPAGSFTMGSPDHEKGRDKDEGPQHVVTFAKPFAVGRLHVTVDQYAAFVQETGYQASTTCYNWSFGNRDGSWRNPGFAQEGSHPVVCLSWDDAKAYVDWMARKTGKPYRLLSEAEFEYSARGRTSPGTYPRFWFGDNERDLCRNANGGDQKARDSIDGAKGWTVAPCNDGYAYTSPAGHYEPNAFGLYDMAGNAWQWTADCYHDSYNGAPSNGSSWATGDCKSGRVVRGGSWGSVPGFFRSARRIGYSDGNDNIGCRLARTLSP